MRETVRRQSVSWMWLAWTIGAFVIVGLGIFFADGVPALIAPWFATRP